MVTRILLKDMLRGIRSSWSQFLSVFAMAALTVIVFVGVTGAADGLQQGLDQYNNDTKPADAWVTGKSLQPSDVTAITDLKGVTRASGGITMTGTLATGHKATAKDPASRHGTPLRVELNAVNAADMPKPKVVKGAKFHVSNAVTSTSNGKQNSPNIWIDTDYASKNNIKVHDLVSVTASQQRMVFRVAGTVHSSEYLYPIDPDSSAPSPSTYGFAYTALGSLPEAMAKGSMVTKGLSNRTPVPATLPTPALNTVRLRLNADGKDHPRRVENDIRHKLGDSFAGFSTRDTRIQTSSLATRITTLHTLALLFSALFALLALTTMLTSITRLVTMQTKEIATMQALGIRPATIRTHFASYGLLIAGLGVVLGFVLAPLTVSKIIFSTYGDMYWMPNVSVSISWVSYAVAAAIILICTFAAALASNKGISSRPALSMHGSQSTGKLPSHPLIEHVKPLWNSMSPTLQWTVRTISSSKVRTLTGILGTLGCMALLCAAFGAQSASNTMPSDLYGKQYTYSAKATLESTADADTVIDAVAQKSSKDLAVQNVEETNIEYRDDNSATGTLTVVGSNKPDDSSAAKSTGSAASTVSGDFVHLDDAKSKTVKLPRTGLLLTDQVAKAMGLHVGDNLYFRDSSSASYLKARIAGIVESPANQGAFISQHAWKHLDRDFKPTALLLGHGRPSMARLRDTSGIAHATTQDRQRAGAVNSVSSFNMIFALLKFAAILLAFVVLYNLAALNFSELGHNYATLRVLGFNQAHIRSSILWQNLSVSIVGWIIGIPAGIAFLHLYLGATASSTLSLNPTLSVSDLAIASVLTLGCSLIVALLTGHKVRRIDMVEALKAGE